MSGKSLFKVQDDEQSLKVDNAVKLSKDQEHGRVWGRQVWRGRPKEQDQEITCTLKRQWILQKLPNYQKFFAKADHVAALIPPIVNDLPVDTPSPVQEQASQ